MGGTPKIAAAVLAVALVAGTSCAQIIGLEPFGSGGAGGASSAGGSATHGSGGAGGGSSSGSPAGTGGGAQCSTGCAKPPGGWSGPVVIADVCPTGSMTTTVTIPPPNLKCPDCGCVAPKACQLQITTYAANDGMCANGVILLPNKDEGCSTVNISGVSNVVVAPVTGSDPSCVIDSTQPCTAPAPQRLNLCSLAACGSGGCVPAGATACVYGSGATCPPGFPESKALGYGQYELSACACGGAATDAKCDPASITFFSHADCTTNPLMATSRVCAGVGDALSVSYVPQMPGDCRLPAAAETVKQQPIHVCCADPT